jgi:arylsulfatase A-like enzyme
MITRTIASVTAAVLLTITALLMSPTLAADRPHIVLVMADDMGWGQTSYQNHPILKTPNLDAMASSGLRLDRFYAGAATCSPTRATVLTGRSNDRAGVNEHGFALRLQEKTLAQAMQKAGYATGHFGKWHLNGLRGPGVPIFADDDHNPGKFGFDEWLSVSTFFDRDPIMSRRGTLEEKSGDSSEIIIEEALQFIEKQASRDKPSFSVVWFGTPHSPFVATDADNAPFEALDNASKNHHGELVAMDRSIGTLRSRLDQLNLSDNTLIWFCSDNGGLPAITPDTVGGLRGNKGSIYEGGLRVPAIIQWPAGITAPRTTHFPASTMDIFPTIAEIVGLPSSSMLQPQDGVSLKKLFTSELTSRDKPIPFRQQGRAAWVDNQFKLLTTDLSKDNFQLYDLVKDPAETVDLMETLPDRAQSMRAELLKWNASVLASIAGKDYPEGKLNDTEREPVAWNLLPKYQSFLQQHGDRPEYRGLSQNTPKKSTGKKKKAAN